MPQSVHRCHYKVGRHWKWSKYRLCFLQLVKHLSVCGFRFVCEKGKQTGDSLVVVRLTMDCVNWVENGWCFESSIAKPLTGWGIGRLDWPFANVVSFLFRRSKRGSDDAAAASGIWARAPANTCWPVSSIVSALRFITRRTSSTSGVLPSGSCLVCEWRTSRISPSAGNRYVILQRGLFL